MFGLSHDSCYIISPCWNYKKICFWSCVWVGQDAVIYMMVSSVAFYICVTQIGRNHLVMSAVLQLLNAKGFHRTVGFENFCLFLYFYFYCLSYFYCLLYSRVLNSNWWKIWELILLYVAFYLILALGMGLMF